ALLSTRRGGAARAPARSPRRYRPDEIRRSSRSRPGQLLLGHHHLTVLRLVDRGPDELRHVLRPDRGPLAEPHRDVRHVLEHEVLGLLVVGDRLLQARRAVTLLDQAVELLVRVAGVVGRGAGEVQRRQVGLDHGVVRTPAEPAQTGELLRIGAVPVLREVQADLQLVLDAEVLPQLVTHGLQPVLVPGPGVGPQGEGAALPATGLVEQALRLFRVEGAVLADARPEAVELRAYRALGRGVP